MREGSKNVVCPYVEEEGATRPEIVWGPREKKEEGMPK